MSDVAPREPEPIRDPTQPLMGAGAVFLGHALMVLLTMVIMMVITTAELGAERLILVIGASQWLYVGPMLVVAWRRHARGFFWGVLAAAAATMLLNGGSWKLVTYWLSGIQ